MAARFSPLRKPLVGAALVAATGGIAYTTYTTFSSRQPAFPMPIVEVKRDRTGRIIPPTSLPVPKSRAEQLADLRRHSSPPSRSGVEGDSPGGGSEKEAEEYDLLIIGGGATGSGIALDAVTRGLKVALVERDDFSSGTSSKSTKLVHGGVRYLEKAVWNLDYPQLELVIEALRERRSFLDVAPHLSSPLPILLPIQRWWQAPYFWAGTKAYDLLAGSQGLNSSYFISRSKAAEAFPLLRKDNLVGALVYYDGQQDDSRMNVSLAVTASLYGATVLNHVEVTALEKDASGRIRGAKVRDLMASPSDGEAAREFSVRAKGVINATGPFADAVERMDDPTRRPIVAPSSGAHVILPGDLCPNGIGLLDAATSDGRVVFVLPWQGRTLAGTTDNACDVEREPAARQDDVDFILREVSKLLRPEDALTRSDVLASWSGIRPLVKDPKAKNTESTVRSHLVTVSDSGLLTCAGGKWTTYRQMAEDAVDEAVRAFDLRPRALPLPDISGGSGLVGPAAAQTTDGTCRTLRTPLVGAHGFSRDLPSQLMEAHDHEKLTPDVAAHLAASYGDRAWSVLEAGPADRIHPNFPHVRGEVLHAARAEAACTAADVLARRTRLAFLDAEAALASLPVVVDLLARELGWGPDRVEEEWRGTVRFLASMGLPASRLGVTREEVLRDREVASAAAAAAAAAAGHPPAGHEGEAGDRSGDDVGRRRGGGYVEPARLSPSSPELGGLATPSGGGAMARDASFLSNSRRPEA